MELLGILIIVAVTFSGGFVMGYQYCKSVKDREITTAKNIAITVGYQQGYQAGYQKAVSDIRAEQEGRQ